ncbi:hypothetical protein C1645_832197 [Glomus cerebriforme]|uniref:Uncharacterized protein n=1 Tax=Glomus cerebriforme TaxID=658196 RepID=A0A397SE15_9GLOM|nr:hypothetical protein C1645_832197 [Glomus cerebriforme]
MLQRILKENNLPKESRPDYKTLFSSYVIPTPKILAKKKIPEDTSSQEEPEDIDLSDSSPLASQALMARSLHPHKGVVYFITDWLDFERYLLKIPLIYPPDFLSTIDPSFHKIQNRLRTDLISKSRDDYINQRLLSQYPTDLDIRRLIMSVDTLTFYPPDIDNEEFADSYNYTINTENQRYTLRGNAFAEDIDHFSRVGYLYTRLILCRHDPKNVHISQLESLVFPPIIHSMLSASFGYNFRLNFTAFIIQEINVNRSKEPEADYNHLNSDYNGLISVLTYFQDDFHAIHSNTPLDTLCGKISVERSKFIQSSALRPLSLKTRRKALSRGLDRDKKTPKGFYPSTFNSFKKRPVPSAPFECSAKRLRLAVSF